MLILTETSIPSYLSNALCFFAQIAVTGANKEEIRILRASEINKTGLSSGQEEQ